MQSEQELAEVLRQAAAGCNAQQLQQKQAEHEEGQEGQQHVEQRHTARPAVTVTLLASRGAIPKGGGFRLR